MSRARFFLVTLAVVGLFALPCQAAGRQVVYPLGEGPMPQAVGRTNAPSPLHQAAAEAINPWDLRAVLTKGAQHIMAQQCPDGGFGWPHDDCSTRYHNIIAPIMMGVLTANYYAPDPDFVKAAKKAADFEMTWEWPDHSGRLHTFSSYFLWQLTFVSGDTEYANYATSTFFDELEAGTYSPADQDTAAYIASVVAGRAGTWVNIVTWDFHVLVPTAAALGHPDQAAQFVDAILDALDSMDNTDPDNVPMDVVGIAGAVRGLAYGNRTSFPAVVAPLHNLVNGVNSLEDLAAVLASLQNADGSWNWHSNLPAPGVTDEDTQTTAYAVMALVEAQPLVSADYSGAIEAGKDWLAAQQLPNGGFAEWPGGAENTEVEGEVLWALGLQVRAEPIPALGGRGLALLTVLLMVASVAILRRRLA